MGTWVRNEARQKSAFTLIELLVVIAIVAILAAILFPVFLRVRDKGREASCKSNMRQIATAVELYIQSWDGCFPDQTSVGIPYTGTYDNSQGFRWIAEFSHRYRTDDGSQAAGIAKTLAPYLKNLGVFKCPSEWRTRPANLNYYLDYVSGSSYYVKHALCYYANKFKRPCKQSVVTYPTRATLMYEEAWHSGWPRPFLWDVNSYPDPATRKPFRRVNSIFMDCHIGPIDVPFHSVSGYDTNWYFYQKGSNWGHNWNVSDGARDKL